MCGKAHGHVSTIAVYIERVEILREGEVIDVEQALFLNRAKHPLFRKRKNNTNGGVDILFFNGKRRLCVIFKKINISCQEHPVSKCVTLYPK